MERSEVSDLEQHDHRGALAGAGETRPQLGIEGRPKPASREPSFWEFALFDYDSGARLTDWRREYQTANITQRSEYKRARSKVTQMPPKVRARRPGDPNSEHLVFVLDLRTPGKKHYHHVWYPRRAKKRRS